MYYVQVLVMMKVRRSFHQTLSTKLFWKIPMRTMTSFAPDSSHSCRREAEGVSAPEIKKDASLLVNKSISSMSCNAQNISLQLKLISCDHNLNLFSHKSEVTFRHLPIAKILQFFTSAVQSLLISIALKIVI